MRRPPLDGTPPEAGEPRPAATTAAPGAFATLLARHAVGAVAAVVLLAGLAGFADHGLTWDGPESYRAGAQNLRIVAAALAGEPLPPWPWHELLGYQFVLDTTRAAFARVANALLFAPGSYRGFHLFNLLLSSLAVALTGWLAQREGRAVAPLARAGGPPPYASVLGPVAATLLALHPKLVGHAIANPKDLGGLVVWGLATLAITAAARTGTLWSWLVLGASLGLAGATHATASLLVPLAVVWVLAAGAGTVLRRLGGLVLAGATAALVGVVCWPWLWPAPLRRALRLAEHVGTFDLQMQVLYLGEVRKATELPWHYGIVSLALATPVLVTAAAAGGLLVALRRRAGTASRLAAFAALWLALVLAADVAAPSRYDGARHLMPALPALALLAAAGLHAGWRGLLAWSAAGPGRRRRAPLAAAAAVVAALLAHGGSLAAVHPYADAWLNLPARWWLAPDAHRQVELEYWGATYAEGCRWLLAHTPAEARVLVPFASHLAEPCLGTRIERTGDFHPGNRRRPHYLMLMAREAWYTPRVWQVVRRGDPVFTIRRQGSLLLAIYRIPWRVAHPAGVAAAPAAPRGAGEGVSRRGRGGRPARAPRGAPPSGHARSPLNQ